MRAPVLVEGGTDVIMATKKNEAEAATITSTLTEGDEVVARGAEDVAIKLASGPRDALIDPQPGDYVPDNVEKGYHVGTVRQPADPVLGASGRVGFESIADEPSKFESAKAQKARSNAREAANPDLYGGQEHVPMTVNRSDITGTGHEERLRSRGIGVREDVSSPATPADKS
jgi:hypothetical protein